MICRNQLTPMQMRRSQRNLYFFNIVNGISYMCLGETVIILLAIRLDCPDWTAAVLGAMIYFGFTLLPLGRPMTARYGAAATQALCWVARNIAAVAVASSTLWHILGLEWLKLASLIAGAYLFYGFRAAGVVMSQPLIGDICIENDRAKVLAVSGGFFYSFCLLTLILVIVVVNSSPSMWTLSSLILFGSAMGVTASRFTKKIDETEALRDSARKPLYDELVEAAHNPSLKKLLAVGFASSFAQILITSVSTVTLKRGYGLSDTSALLYSLALFAASAASSFLTGAVSRKIGPRKTMFYIYSLFIAAPALWLISDMSGAPSVPVCILIFAAIGAGNVGMNNTIAHYFLQTVPTSNRIAASTVLNVVTGAAAGIAGIAVSACLLHAASAGSAAGFPLDSYMRYFKMTLFFIIPGIVAIFRLTPLPEEKRRIKRLWPHV